MGNGINRWGRHSSHGCWIRSAASLIALEAQRSIPFEIKRVYYIFGTQPGVVRGLHAHKELEQVAVCINGTCKFLMDDGRHRWTVSLDRPDRGLFIGPIVWHEMSEFSPDCVLMVLASDRYDERDYIRDYDEFLGVVGQGVSS